MIVFSLRQRSRLRASENWPAITGTITQAGIVESRSSDSTEYNLHVSYEYLVNGSTYIGKRIEFSRRGYARKKNAQAQLEQYPVNSTVVVYVSPDRPDDAVLVRAAPYNTLYFVMGLLMVGLALAIVIFTAARR
jgi:hypothetical protein